MRRGEHGFSYLGLLFAVTIASGTMAAAAALWSTEAKREREADLLFAGDQFRAAIAAYYNVVPEGQAHVFPRSFDDLLEDKRWQVKRRHLRRVFVDPMTGGTDWGIVEAPGGGIMGVYSKGAGEPLKRARFPATYAEFGEAGRYADWRFVHVPGVVPAARGGGAQTN